jgi:WD40 repeat protein/tetratricopeptide (TPR) repeat protein
VARIGVQVADALDHAHKQGIIHRDIKPSNLLLDLQGTVWVTDFGLAKAEGADNLTHTGDVLGTLRYMPPEAFDGKADARGDVYSLGLTLYELVTLRPAFDERDRKRLIKQVTTAEPERLGRMRRGVPRDLETIVTKAIDKDPARRYQTAAELRDDLQRFVEDQPIKARRQSEWERARRWARHHPAVAALAACIALLLVGVTVVSVIAAARFERVAANERHAREDAEEAKREAERERGRAEDHLYFTRIALAARAWEAGDVRTAENLLALGVPGPDVKDRRGWEWHYLRSLCRSELRSFADHRSPDVTGVAFSPDGRLLASVALANGEKDREVIVRDLAAGREVRRWVYPFTSEVPWDIFQERIHFSPDGSMLAVGSREFTTPKKVWATATWTEVPVGRFPPIQRPRMAEMRQNDVRLTRAGTAEVVLRGHTGEVESVEFDRDGGRAATGGRDQTVRVWDVQTGSELLIYRGHRNTVHGVAFSPGGDRLASTGSDGRVLVWNLTRAQRGLLTGPAVEGIDGEGDNNGEWLASMVFEARGEQLTAISCYRRPRLATLDASTGTVSNRRPLAGLRIGPTDHPTGYTEFAPLVALAADGDCGAGPRAGKPGEVTVFDLFTGRERTVLRGHTTDLLAVAISPDGKQVAAVAEKPPEVKVWDANTGKAVVAMTVEAGDTPTAIAFTPDGAHVATLHPRSPRVRIWGVPVEKPTELFDVDPGDVGPGGGRLTFSPDGTKLAVIGRGSQLAMFDVPSGGLRFRAPGPPSLDAVAFSPDSRRIAGAGRRGGVHLWDADTGQEVLILERFGPRPPGNYTFAARVLFSPDGTRLAANNWNGTISVWSNHAPEKSPHLLESLERVNARRLAVLEAAIRARPSDPMPLLERARYHQEHGDRAASDADVARARELAKDDPELLISMSRVLAASGREAEADDVLADVARRAPHELHRVLNASWRVAGPVPGDLATADPAEKDAGSLAWKAVLANRYGLLNLGEFAGGKPGESAYVLGIIPSPDARTGTLLIGGHATRLWVNGRFILETPWTGTWPWGLMRVAVTLRRGRNTVLVRVARPPDGETQLMCRLADGPEDRALDLGLRGLWPEAAAEARRVRIGPEVHSWWLLTMARLFLLTGDRASYQRVCREMATRPVDDDWIRAGILESDAGFPLEKLVEAARTAVRKNASWTRTNLGVAEYQAGQFEQAVADLKAAGDDSGRPILAMAYHRLGKKDEARRALAASAARMKVRLDRFLAGPRPRAFHSWDWNLSNIYLFHAEAWRLIHGDKSEVDFKLEPLAAAGRADREAADPQTVDFDLAVHVWPERPQGYLVRGERRMELTRTREAAADFAKALEIEKTPANLQAARKTAVRDAAVFAELVRLRPKDADLWTARGQYLQAAGKKKEAAEAFAEAAKQTAEK